jgi:hypothetical protein
MLQTLLRSPETTTEEDTTKTRTGTREGRRKRVRSDYRFPYCPPFLARSSPIFIILNNKYEKIKTRQIIV